MVLSPYIFTDLLSARGMRKFQKKSHDIYVLIDMFNYYSHRETYSGSKNCFNVS